MAAYKFEHCVIFPLLITELAYTVNWKILEKISKK
jgi:hypothetical protein